MDKTKTKTGILVVICKSVLLSPLLPFEGKVIPL